MNVILVCLVSLLTGAVIVCGFTGFARPDASWYLEQDDPDADTDIDIWEKLPSFFVPEITWPNYDHICEGFDQHSTDQQSDYVAIVKNCVWQLLVSHTSRPITVLLASVLLLLTVLCIALRRRSRDHDGSEADVQNLQDNDSILNDDKKTFNYVENGESEPGDLKDVLDVGLPRANSSFRETDVLGGLLTAQESLELENVYSSERDRSSPGSGKAVHFQGDISGELMEDMDIIAGSNVALNQSPRAAQQRLADSSVDESDVDATAADDTDVSELNKSMTVYSSVEESKLNMTAVSVVGKMLRRVARYFFRHGDLDPQTMDSSVSSMWDSFSVSNISHSLSSFLDLIE